MVYFFFFPVGVLSIRTGGAGRGVIGGHDAIYRTAEPTTLWAGSCRDPEIQRSRVSRS